QGVLRQGADRIVLHHGPHGPYLRLRRQGQAAARIAPQSDCRGIRRGHPPGPRTRLNTKHHQDCRQRNPIMKTLVKTLLLAGALAASTAFAQVKVENAWVRATVPNQQATGAFLNITSDKDARLVGASSSLLPNVEIHEMAMENDVMKM